MTEVCATSHGLCKSVAKANVTSITRVLAQEGPFSHVSMIGAHIIKEISMCYFTVSSISKHLFYARVN